MKLCKSFFVNSCILTLKYLNELQETKRIKPQKNLVRGITVSNLYMKSFRHNHKQIPPKHKRILFAESKMLVI